MRKIHIENQNEIINNMYKWPRKMWIDAHIGRDWIRYHIGGDNLMKVLILANSDIGLYKFRKELIIELIDKENDVYISLPDGDYVKLLEKLGCIFVDTPMDRRGINFIKDANLLHYYKKIIKEIDPDIVITYTIKPNIYGGIAARNAKKTYAVNITGLGSAFENKGIIRALVINLYKYALKKSKVIFFENYSNRDELVSLGCCKKEKTYVLNGAGVNTETFYYLPYPDNEKIKFLFIGRVMKEKGVNELFEAMKKLQEDGMNCFLDVVGPFEENYKEILEKYEKEGWLKYHGYQGDVRPFISSCDCFVLPSYHEGMANTNLECASSGRPIITSNIPGCKEAVIESSGILCEPRNMKDLYCAMKRIINMSREERIQMGKCGRNHMKEVFEKKKVIYETIKCLK